MSKFLDFVTKFLDEEISVEGRAGWVGPQMWTLAVEGGHEWVLWLFWTPKFSIENILG